MFLLVGLVLKCTLAGAAASFNWSAIPSTRSLEYQECYQGFECARLQVPLDWNNSGSGRHAAIAIIRLPAVVSSDHPAFGGTVITNPGGPGGSGVSDLLLHGHHIQNMIDGSKYFEILSFDPRGIGHSTPRAECFESEAARQLFAFQQRETGPLNEGSSVIIRRRAHAEAFGEICANAHNNPQSQSYEALTSMSTANVARDMLEIVDQIELQRQRQGLGAVVPRLQYIGFSYGTQLGNTFASMFPDRVKSMVLDGVVDSNDYSAGAWSSNLFDTETAAQHFYTSCFEANGRCTLKDLSDTSGMDIKSRVDSALARLVERPGIWLERGFSEVVTAQAVRELFLLPLYVPVALFESLASSLLEVLNGNYSSVVRDMQRDAPTSSRVCRLPDDQDDYSWGFDAALTYICNDGQDLTNISNTNLEKYVDGLLDLSPTFGAYWAQFGLTCSGWRLRPTWRFAGPYGRVVSRQLSGHQVPLNDHTDDASPVLFLSSRSDPATPLRNAVAMSALHPGSAVVIQESVGHCAIYSSPSKCTKQIVQDYFTHGHMPPNGTVCTQDCGPWEPGCEGFETESLGSVRRWQH